MKRSPARAAIALLGAVVVMLLTGAGSVTAGGWAVTTLDPIPRAPTAGGDMRGGFTVRQHGVTPVSVDGVAISIERPGGADRRTFEAAEDGPVGHYVAVVRFPSSGAWSWQVQPGWFAPQELGTVSVGTAGATAIPGPSRTGAGLSVDASIRVALLMATLAAGAGTIVLLTRNRGTASRSSMGEGT